MNEPAWLAAERDHENSEVISVVIVPRTELTRLRAIETAVRQYVRSCRLTEGLVAVRAPNPEAGASSEETWRLFELLEGLIGGGNAH